MRNKDELLADLTTVFHNWETFLAGKSEAEITARPGPEEWAVLGAFQFLGTVL